MRGETLFGIAITPGLRGAAIRIAYGGALATLAAGAGLALLWSRGKSGVAGDGLRSVVLFGCLLFLGVFPSAIWSHLAFVAAPLLLVLVAVLDASDRALSDRSALAGWGWRGSWSAVALAAAVATAGISLDLRR